MRPGHGFRPQRRWPWRRRRRRRRRQQKWPQQQLPWQIQEPRSRSPRWRSFRLDVGKRVHGSEGCERHRRSHKEQLDCHPQPSDNSSKFSSSSNNSNVAPAARSEIVCSVVSNFNNNQSSSSPASASSQQQQQSSSTIVAGAARDHNGAHSSLSESGARAQSSPSTTASSATTTPPPSSSSSSSFFAFPSDQLASYFVSEPLASFLLHAAAPDIVWYVGDRIHYTLTGQTIPRYVYTRVFLDALHSNAVVRASYCFGQPFDSSYERQYVAASASSNPSGEIDSANLGQLKVGSQNFARLPHGTFPSSTSASSCEHGQCAGLVDPSLRRVDPHDPQQQADLRQASHGPLQAPGTSAPPLQHLCYGTPWIGERTDSSGQTRVVLQYRPYAHALVKRIGAFANSNLRDVENGVALGRDLAPDQGIVHSGQGGRDHRRVDEQHQNNSPRSVALVNMDGHPAPRSDDSLRQHDQLPASGRTSDRLLDESVRRLDAERPANAQSHCAEYQAWSPHAPGSVRPRESAGHSSHPANGEAQDVNRRPPVDNVPLPRRQDLARPDDENARSIDSSSMHATSRPDARGAHAGGRSIPSAHDEQPTGGRSPSGGSDSGSATRAPSAPPSVSTSTTAATAAASTVIDDAARALPSPAAGQSCNEQQRTSSGSALGLPSESHVATKKVSLAKNSRDRHRAENYHAFNDSLDVLEQTERSNPTEHSITRSSHSTKLAQLSAYDRLAVHSAKMPPVDLAAVIERATPAVRERMLHLKDLVFHHGAASSGATIPSSRDIVNDPPRAFTTKTAFETLIRDGIVELADSNATRCTMSVFGVLEEHKERIRMIFAHNDGNAFIKENGYVCDINLGHVAHYYSHAEGEIRFA